MNRFTNVFALEEPVQDAHIEEGFFNPFVYEDIYKQVVRLLEEDFEMEMAALPRLRVEQQDLQPMEEEEEVHEVNYRTVDALRHYRFSIEEIERIAELLRLAPIIKSKHGYLMRRVKGLCLVLYRLSWPTRFLETVKIFHRSESALCSLFNTILELNHEEWKHLLLFDHVRLSPKNFRANELVDNTESGEDEDGEVNDGIFRIQRQA